MTMRITSVLLAILLSGPGLARADDGLGLARAGNAGDVSVSGVSSGAAMAVQYAVAHSGSIVGVGVIAGPGWGCAEDRVSQAINDCMCGRHPVIAQTDTARALAAGAGKIDPLVSGKPRALKRAYVFHSAKDATVAEQSGQAGIEFLTAFIGTAPVIDRGSPADGSDRAGHGIISPQGADACQADGRETTYVRRCGAADNAGRLFLALYGQGESYDPGSRIADIPEHEVWQFSQQRLVDDVTAGAEMIAPDRTLWFYPYRSARRKHLDMAATGYVYVPPGCRRAGSRCRVHVALHGCKQDARTFAITAGYNNWAEHYRVIVVYPALAPDAPQTGEVCRMAPVPAAADNAWFEPNPNGCWDWWGYLDADWLDGRRYLTQDAPQMRVIERIIAEVTRPVR